MIVVFHLLWSIFGNSLAFVRNEKEKKKMGNFRANGPKDSKVSDGQQGEVVAQSNQNNSLSQTAASSSVTDPLGKLNTDGSSDEPAPPDIAEVLQSVTLGTTENQPQIKPLGTTENQPQIKPVEVHEIVAVCASQVHLENTQKQAEPSSTRYQEVEESEGPAAAEAIEQCEKQEIVVVKPSQVEVLNARKPHEYESKIEQKVDELDGFQTGEPIEQYDDKQEAIDYCKQFEYMNYPFFNDINTVSHISKSKTMFILRGLSGSGKSTIVEVIRTVYKEAVVCSADDYFMKSGEYRFNPKQLSSAHNECQAKARHSCEHGHSPVVIDNTNVRRWEMTEYFKIATMHGYLMIVVVPQTPWKFDAEVLAARNKHCVGVDVLADKVKQFQSVMPIYWGWFVNSEGQDTLYALAEKYFGMCMHHFPDFESKLCLWLGLPEVQPKLQAVYAGTMSKSLHCTAYFVGMKNRSSDTAHNYANDPNVLAATCQIQDVEISGFNFTVGTAGAQVKLAEDQLPLFENDDWHESLPAGSKAHITLGVSDGVKPVQTGSDQIEMIKLARKNFESCQESTDDATLLYFPDGFCHVQLAKPFKTSTIFSGMY